MTEYEFSFREARASYKTISHSIQLERYNKNVRWYPSQPMDWDIILHTRIASFFQKCNYPFRYIEEIPFEEPVRSNIRRFFLSLDAYKESPNPVMPIREILIGATLKEYASRLKKIRRKSIILTWGANQFATPDWFNDVPGYQINDIGDIFNFAYTLPWNDECEDYLEGFIPLSMKDVEQEFKNSLRELLPDPNSFERVDSKEVLSTVSSSMCFENGKTHPHYIKKPNHLAFSKERGICKRSVIFVSPDNIRDTVINSVEDLNTISWIDKQTMLILDKMSNHIHSRDNSLINRRLKKLSEKYLYFVHRDIKKEGITKPRIINKWILEVLHETYPDIVVYSYTSFFDRYSVMLDNGDIIHPVRGVGLGMSNALTTLMQLAIANMISGRSIELGEVLDYSVLCLNDDYVAGFKSEEDADTYWDLEDEVMSDLGLIRQEDKSFVSYDRYVIAERYIVHSEEYEKVSYQLREIYLPLACYNIIQAKNYFSSCQVYVKRDIVDSKIDEIISYWGYEFYPKEYLAPFLLGGWINNTIYGIDMTLVMMDSMEINDCHSKAFQAIHKTAKKKDVGVYMPPISKLYGVSSVPKEFADALNYISLSRAEEKFDNRISISRSRLSKYWKRIENTRAKTYNKASPMCYDDLITSLLETNKEFYPNRALTQRYEPYDIIEFSINDIYTDPNPICAAMNYFIDNSSTEFKEVYSISFVNGDYIRRNKVSIFDKDPNREIKRFELDVDLSGDSLCIIPKDESIQIQEYYNSPLRIGQVAAMIDWGRGYPIPRYRHPLLERKREIYGRLFSIKELISLSGIRRSVIKVISDYANKSGLSIDEVIEILEELIEPEEIPETPSEEEEEPEEEHGMYPQEYMDRLLTIAAESEEEESSEEQIEDIPDEPEEVDELEWYRIDMDRLVENPKSKFFLWRDNRSEAIVMDQDTDMMLSRMNNVLFQITSSTDRLSIEERERAVEEEIGDDPILRQLVTDAGFLQLLHPSEEQEVDLDTGDSLFGEDW